MGTITLLTGGARSGKSAHALRLADQSIGARRYFVATAEALDSEMATRIAHHRESRPRDFVTVEEPIDVAGALTRLDNRADLVIVDCLTLWVSNLMTHHAADAEDAIQSAAENLARTMLAAPFATIVVTDEVGYGIVPVNPNARRFRDLLGWTNQTIARAAETVILMVAGYPLRVK